jgi:hypothetical protein
MEMRLMSLRCKQGVGELLRKIAQIYSAFKVTEALIRYGKLLNNFRLQGTGYRESDVSA